MKEFFIQFGTVNKKLILLAIQTVLYIIMNVIEITTKMKELHIILDLYTRGISYSLAFVVPLVLKCWDKKNKVDTEESEKEKEKCRCTKQSVLLFGFLHFVYICYFGIYIVLSSLKKRYKPEETEDLKMSHYHGLCTEEAIEIIFILIVSKILLKTKLYIHHYIGLIIFIAFSIGIDVLLDLSIIKPGLLFLSVYILLLILDSIFITFEKYMMDKKYYSPYTIIVSIGILFLVTSLFFTILILCKGNMIHDGTKYKLQDFKDYFEQNDVKEVIGHIFYLTGFRFVQNILKILTIYYFTQNHVYLSYIIIKLVDYLITKKSWKKYLCIILFVFQFFGFLVYLEILELNFLNLNKNTKKNIELREIEEEGKMLLCDEDSRISEVEEDKDGKKVNKVEISPGYTVVTEMANINHDSRDSLGLQDTSRDSTNFQDSRVNENDENTNFELTQKNLDPINKSD